LLALCLSESEPDCRWIGARFRADSWLRGGNCTMARAMRGHWKRLERISDHTGLPLAAAGDVHMHLPLPPPAAGRAHRDPPGQAGARIAAMRCSRTASAPAHANGAERIYGPEPLRETLRIAERCGFSLDELRYEYPEEIVPAERPRFLPRKLALAGLDWRYPAARPQMSAR
jgi:error-prone DNA polymerase